MSSNDGCFKCQPGRDGCVLNEECPDVDVCVTSTEDSSAPTTAAPTLTTAAPTTAAPTTAAPTCENCTSAPSPAPTNTGTAIQLSLVGALVAVAVSAFFY